MLLRAGLLYFLAVSSLLLGLLAGWQRLELGAGRETAGNLARRIERLTAELEGAQLKASSAERRALVAEDSLSRFAQPAVAPPPEELARLRFDLEEAGRERDAARTEAHVLAGQLEGARKALQAAEAARDDALEDARLAEGEVKAAREALAQQSEAVARAPAPETTAAPQAGAMGHAQQSPSNDAVPEVQAAKPGTAGAPIVTNSTAGPAPATGATGSGATGSVETAAPQFVPAAASPQTVAPKATAEIAPSASPPAAPVVPAKAAAPSAPASGAAAVSANPEAPAVPPKRAAAPSKPPTKAAAKKPERKRVVVRRDRSGKKKPSAPVSNFPF